MPAIVFLAIALVLVARPDRPALVPAKTRRHRPF